MQPAVKESAPNRADTLNTSAVIDVLEQLSALSRARLSHQGPRTHPEYLNELAATALQELRDCIRAGHYDRAALLECADSIDGCCWVPEMISSHLADCLTQFADDAVSAELVATVVTAAMRTLRRPETQEELA